jgi:hypothetical protein
VVLLAVGVSPPTLFAALLRIGLIAGGLDEQRKVGVGHFEFVNREGR